jgi:hypothetical protein
MKIDIHERDIESGLRQTCAACGRITFKLGDTTTRYRKFLRQIDRQKDGTSYSCRVYGASELPELCREFNCVSWAKAGDHCSDKNSLIKTAQETLDRLRESGRK